MHLSSLERRVMNRISRTIHDMHNLDEMAERDVWINHVHPLSKVIVTIMYLVLVMSYEKGNLIGLCGMSLYLIILIILGEIPLRQALYRLRFVLLAVLLLGIANPIFDRQVVANIGSVAITSGMISMITLFLKAGMAVLASFILIQTTSIENICYALRKLHVPKVLVTLILLIYRYVILMLKETERITQAYSLRAPGQKGIHYKSWGSLAGQLLLRSMDKAELVYESMMLRGFTGEFHLKGNGENIIGSIVYCMLWCIVLLLLRVFPVFQIVGGIF